MRGLRGAPITGALLAANAGVFAAQVSLAGQMRFALGGGDPRDHALWNAILRWLGGNDSTFTIADTRLETLVTSCFLHGSILHLGFNMLVLWQVGPFLEHLEQFNHLHLHDNHGLSDEHLALGDGSIDWAAVGPQVKRRYSGIAVVEGRSLEEARKSAAAFRRWFV